MALHYIHPVWLHGMRISVWPSLGQLACWGTRRLERARHWLMRLGRRRDTSKHRIRSSTEALLAFATNITRTVHQWHCAHRSRQVRERMMYASTRESCKKELGAALWVGDYFASEKHEVPLRPTNLLTLATTHDARAHTHLPSFLDAHLRRPPARRPVPVRSNL